MQQTTDQHEAGEESSQSQEMKDVERKVRRMLMSSVLVMVFGILAVLGVLIYKSVSNNESVGTGQVVGGAIVNQLKPGETIRSMMIENSTVYLLVDGKGMTSVLEMNKKSGFVTRRIEFIPQAD